MTVPSSTTENSLGHVLITGANGSNGQEIVKLFTKAGLPVRVMVRNQEKAADLRLPGVEIVQGDFNQPETLSKALADIEKAFLLTSSSERAEEQQRSFVEAARRSGVKHIVKLSQLGAASDAPNRFLRYHAAVEKAIQDSGLHYTFLQPNLFMQGLLNFKPTIQSQNAFYAAAGEGQVSVVDVRDIAEVAFAALTQKGHENKSYELTGPEALTHTEMAKQLSTALGRPIQFVDVSPQQMLEAILSIGFPQWQADGLIEEYAQYSQNHASEIATGVQDAIGKQPRNFQQFARDYAPELQK